jgi:hypothetical protein
MSELETYIEKLVAKTVRKEVTEMAAFMSTQYRYEINKSVKRHLAELPAATPSPKPKRKCWLAADATKVEHELDTIVVYLSHELNRTPLSIKWYMYRYLKQELIND